MGTIIMRVGPNGEGLVRLCGVRGKQTPRCAFCGASGLRLCDGPKDGGGTCDRPICPAHARHTEPDLDLCPVCAWPGVPMPPLSSCQCGKRIISAMLDGQPLLLLPTPINIGAYVLERKSGTLVAAMVDLNNPPDRRRWAKHTCAKRG